MGGFFVMKYFVYIIRSERNGTFYKGHCSDLTVRMKEHNRGKTSYTRSLRPWTLVWYTEKSFLKEAKVLEEKIKNITATDRLLRFIEKYPCDLSRFDSPDAANADPDCPDKPISDRIRPGVHHHESLS